MAIDHWNPFGDIVRLQEHLLGSLANAERPRRFVPAVDIYENKDAIVIEMALPGIKADGVNLEVTGSVLTISGERRSEREERDDGGVLRIESTYGTFNRSFALPENVSSGSIEAELRDGILRVRLPKREEAARRTIAVRSAASGSKSEGKRASDEKETIEQPKVRVQRDAEQRRASEQEADEREAAE
jgi:HSP20 family protein